MSAAILNVYAHAQYIDNILRMRGKSGRGKPREFGAKHLRGKGKREMNGLHIPGTPLVVDYWKQKHVQPRALFFLSHLHAGEAEG